MDLKTKQPRISVPLYILGVMLSVAQCPVCVFGAGDSAAAPADADKPATSQSAADKSSQDADPAEKFVSFYLEMYGKHLRSKDWMSRAMAVIGLARIDDARTTAKLIEVMTADKSRIVRVYAWEALHARQDRLTSEQHGQWVAGVFKLSRKNTFRGDLRLGLLGLMKAGGPTVRNKDLFKKIFNTTNSMDPNDIRSLWAMGDALKRWQSPDLIKNLINMMDELDNAYRAEVILRRVHDGIPHSATLTKQGSKVMWATTQKRWIEWFKKTDFEEIDIGVTEPYAGLSAIMPRGEKIDKTRDEKWRKDLELKRCRLGRLEVAFALDSTGSMGATVRWIQRDVVKMMRAFELISREPRISVTLFRDHGDEYVVHCIPLLGSAGRLARALRKATAKGGGDIPEAVYEALYTLVKKQKWSKGPTVRKVVILVGDAPPHKKTLEKIERLVTSAAKNRFGFYCIKVHTRHRFRTRLPNYDRSLSTFDRIAEWGNGRSLQVDFMEARRSWRSMGTANPQDKNDSEHVLLREVLKVILEEGYSDRIEPFIGVLLEYVDAPVKEKRHPFGPWRPSKPSKPSKPRDPQAR